MMKLKTNRLKGVIKRTAMVGAGALLLLVGLTPMLKAFAEEPASIGNYARIELHGATSLDDAANVTSVEGTYEHATVTVSGTGLYADGNNMVYAPNGSDVTVDVNAEANYTATLTVGGDDTQGSTLYLYNVSGADDVKMIDVNVIQNQPQNPPIGQGNFNEHATINLSAGMGTYQKREFNPETGEEMMVDTPYDNEINLRVNGESWNPEQSTVDYNVEPSNMVVFTFETLWINRFYDDIVINDHTYSLADCTIYVDGNCLDYNDRTSWLMHTDGAQLLSFSIGGVPKSDAYNIVVKHGKNSGPRYSATFLWTGDPEQAGGHNYIGHSKLEFVKAKYTVGEDEFTVTEGDIAGNTMREGNFETFRSIDGFMTYGVTADVDYDDGSLTVPGEAEVTMRVVPDYGYQVTSVNGGGDFATTDEGVSEFTVVVHNGEAGYFQATVERVDNAVEATSEKVRGGEIRLGENAATDIANGTVKLSVEDVELPAEKITNFQNKATEAGGYQIASYLDINLNKVLYRGSADAEWPEQIHHLSNKALISLQLAEGVDGTSIVLVHNIDDGEEFEIIPIESYDPVTNIITFYTDSFSNYAIATKTVNAPETGTSTQEGASTASILAVVSGAVIASVVAIFAIRKRSIKQ